MEQFISTSDDLGGSPIELFGIVNDKKNENTIKVNDEYRTIDAGFWLKFAAEHYHISPNLRDYIMVPVPTLITELPNTNGDCVTKEELLTFIPDQGKLAYKTWKGKICCEEHQNQDITKAKGVILDVYLKRLNGFGNNKHYKLIMLLAFDRTKDPALCNAILDGSINTYSVGMYFDSYSCSICGSRVGKNYGSQCSHTKLKQPTYVSNGGKLAYRHMHSVLGFECSAVRDPAYSIALTPHDMVLNR